MSKVFTITEGLENLGALRSGGQGSVYKGRRVGPIVSAVKLLPTPIHTESTDDKNYRSFLNEVAKLKKVNEIPNPNVVKILNSGITESGSLPFIEMEFIEGPDLSDLLQPPHDPIFTIKEVIKLADQLACALSHCHKVGVKHGDIKSNNVKFNTQSGNYVLLDFGLSVMSDEQRRSSIRNAGAVEFMAPEQYEGAMLFRTDIYSYGVVLYELLAGQVPFPLMDGGEMARNKVMLAHMESPVPDLLALRKQKLPEVWPEARKDSEMRVPDWLLKVIAKCLEKLPENRYKNGAVLHEAISEGSAGVQKDERAGYAIAELQAENEKLKELVAQLQETELVKKPVVTLPRSVFNSLIILLITAITYGAYKTYKSRGIINKTPAGTYTSVKPQQNTNPDTDLSKSNNMSGIDIPATDTANTAVHKPVVKKKIHKKKKKFLGIF